MVTSAEVAAARGTVGGRLRLLLRELYQRDTPRARRFRYAMLAFDVAVVAFVVATSFLPGRPAWVEVADVSLGVVLLAEYAARLRASPRPWREALHPAGVADLVAVLSFLAPLAGEGAGFLRALRFVRLLRARRVVETLRRDVAYFRRNEEVFVAATDMAVFVFVMTGIVYETQRGLVPQIANYADALYFTVTALTTTGFGDITLPGTTGRMISVVVMIAGVTLFFRLAASVVRPSKVRHPCPNCALQRHEPDAVHCKACGIVLNIPDEGD